MHARAIPGRGFEPRNPDADTANRRHASSLVHAMARAASAIWAINSSASAKPSALATAG